MTVAFDAFSNNNQTNNTHSWTHTPVGTPRGAIVAITTANSGVTTDIISSVTYGGETMTEVAGSPNLQGASGERCGVWMYFLGAGLPTGAQTVTVTHGATGVVRSGAMTVTAAADTESVDVDATILSGNITNPSVVLSLGGRTSFAMIAFGSGQDGVTGITPLTDWTSQLKNDFGTGTGGWFTYDTIGTADVTAGWTQTGDDAAAIAIAISEPVSAVKHRRTLLGVGA